MPLVKQILVSLVLVAAAAGGWYFYADARTPGPGEAAPGAAGGRAERIPGLAGRSGGINVIVAPVETDSTGELVTAIGTAKAKRSVTVYPQVSGMVAEVAFTPGEAVEAGDVLIRLDDEEEKVAVERARVALAQANDTLERSRRLADSRTISTVALSDAENAAKLAGIELRAAEIALARRTVAAPFAGVTGLSDIAIGDFVTSSSAVTALSDLSQILVGFEVPERWAPRIRTGAPIEAGADGLPGIAFAGTVTAIDNKVDDTTRTLRMEATLDNEAGAIKPGMAITVSMDFKSDERLAVPSLAVLWDRQGSFVWKVDGETVSRADVSILSRRAGVAVVSGALEPGDRVVTEGVQRLRQGVKVAVLAAPGEVVGGEAQGETQGEAQAGGPASRPNG